MDRFLIHNQNRYNGNIWVTESMLKVSNLIVGDRVQFIITVKDAGICKNEGGYEWRDIIEHDPNNKPDYKEEEEILHVTFLLKVEEDFVKALKDLAGDFLYYRYEGIFQTYSLSLTIPSTEIENNFDLIKEFWQLCLPHIK